MGSPRTGVTASYKSYHTDTWSQTQAFCKSNVCPPPLSHLLSSTLIWPKKGSVFREFCFEWVGKLRGDAPCIGMCRAWEFRCCDNWPDIFRSIQVWAWGMLGNATYSLQVSHRLMSSWISVSFDTFLASETILEWPLSVFTYLLTYVCMYFSLFKVYLVFSLAWHLGSWLHHPYADLILYNIAMYTADT